MHRSIRDILSQSMSPDPKRVVVYALMMRNHRADMQGIIHNRDVRQLADPLEPYQIRDRFAFAPSRAQIGAASIENNVIIFGIQQHNGFRDSCGPMEDKGYEVAGGAGD
jgi:hypothetical protein